MATGHARVTDWATPTLDDGSLAPAPPATLLEDLRPLAPERLPVDEDLILVAAELSPGKALDLGCGAGQDSIWLAQRGWTVTAVDPSAAAIEDARVRAVEAAVTIVFHVADLASWRPASRFDLVVLTDALPPRGMGRGRALEMAAAAVALGGCILVSELDSSLAREGRMAERYLVSRDELERSLDGFRIDRSTTRLACRRHGFDDLVLPVASVVASRRTDLRSL